MRLQELPERRIYIPPDNRHDHGTRPDHEQNIGDVTSNDITYSDFRHSAEGGLQGNEQFRGRGAKADNRQSDDQFGVPCPLGYRNAAANKTVTPCEPQNEAIAM